MSNSMDLYFQHNGSKCSYTITGYPEHLNNDLVYLIVSPHSPNADRSFVPHQFKELLDEILKWIVECYGFVLNCSEYQNRTVSCGEFCVALKKTVSMDTPQNRYAFNVLNELGFTFTHPVEE